VWWINIKNKGRTFSGSKHVLVFARKGLLFGLRSLRVLPKLNQLNVSFTGTCFPVLNIELFFVKGFFGGFFVLRGLRNFRAQKLRW